MKKAFIIRGIPGSGKSTFAKNLKEYLENMDGEGVVAGPFEADDYFVKDGGEYKFDPKQIGNAHNDCFRKFQSAINSGKYEAVIVSNTFTKLWEFKNYIQLAKTKGYEVDVIRMTGTFQNIHNVPKDKVQQMLNRFEDYKGEILIDPKK